MTYSDGTNSGFSRRNHYVGQPAVKVGSSNFDYYRKPEKSHGFAKRVAFFAYFPLLILWLETDLKIASGFDVLGGFAFTFLFTIVLSAVLVLLCSFSKRRFSSGTSMMPLSSKLPEKKRKTLSSRLRAAP